MKKLSEVITLVAGLNENKGLTESMIDYAESDSSNQIMLDRDDIPETEFHDSEGVYEIKISTNPAVESQLRNIKHEANGLSYRMTNDATALQNELKFLAGLTVEEVATRKTKDGQKLWKKISKSIKNIEKLFHTGLPNHFEILEYNFISQDVRMKGEAEIFKHGVRNSNHQIYMSYIWLRDLKHEVKRLEKLDQQNKTAMLNETVYARLSFRRQDVLGMTHLGNYSSCQNLHDGFSDHARCLAASVMSPDLGTLTLHATMESATARDNFTRHTAITRNDDLLATARDNIIKDAYGNIITNGHVYTQASRGYSMMQAVKDLLTEAGILKEELTGKPDLFNGHYEWTTNFNLEADITFNVFGNVDMDDLIYNITTEHEIDDETTEQLESDDLTEDEKLDIIENLGLMDDVMQYVVDQLDDVELPEWSYDMSVVGDDWKEINVSDDDILYEVDTDDIKSIGYDEIYYNWSRDELQDALECGTVSVYVNYNVRMEREDSDDAYIAPYDEGEISRWV